MALSVPEEQQKRLCERKSSLVKLFEEITPSPKWYSSKIVEGSVAKTDIFVSVFGGGGKYTFSYSVALNDMTPTSIKEMCWDIIENRFNHILEKIENEWKW